MSANAREKDFDDNDDDAFDNPIANKNQQNEKRDDKAGPGSLVVRILVAACCVIVLILLLIYAYIYYKHDNHNYVEDPELCMLNCLHGYCNRTLGSKTEYCACWANWTGQSCEIRLGGSSG
eukprot:SAG31_NODE_738_length_12447_cov_4.809848_3_plen_121_part_00